MRSSIIQLSFTIISFICWSTLSKANDNSLEFPNYDNEFGSHLCKNKEIISFNFTNARITSIGRNFINSPWITCLNFTNTGIKSIEKGAFEKLPNLTQLILSNNEIKLKNLFYFGGHKNLKVLILNSATTRNYHDFSYIIDYIIDISEEYSELEILSVRRNNIRDLQTSIIEKTPFPKLKFLDLSSNDLQSTNFVTLLPESLYFLDLHDNSLNSLAFNQTQVNLLALNLDGNNLKFMKKCNDSRDYLLYNPHDLSSQYDYRDYKYRRMHGQNDQHNLFNFGLVMAGLKNLQYLSISKNKIDFVESNTFEDTNKLVYLNLSRNEISYLHSKTFEKLQFLRSLDLSFNKFKDVPQISNETIISMLNLNYNNIININSNAFVQMPELTILLLVGNQIDEIHAKAFAELALLEVLDLSRNKLSFLPKTLSKSLMSLKYLNLDHNKFTSLESLSLMTNVLPSMEVHLAMNPLKYLDVSYLKNLPQNITLHLM